MARGIRLEYEGAIYHVTARGYKGGVIFRDNDDRRRFLETLGEACGTNGWVVHGWVLTETHYRLCIETPAANLMTGMTRLQNMVAIHFNKRHKTRGRLFGERYRAIPVEPDKRFLRILLDYIHLNPVRAGTISPQRKEMVSDYPWSSIAGGFALPPDMRPRWFCAEKYLQEYGLPDTNSGRQELLRKLNQMAATEPTCDAGVPPIQAGEDNRTGLVRRGSYLGSKAFGDKLKGLIAKTEAERPLRNYAVPKPFHAEEIAKISQLYDEGKPVSAIEKETGLHRMRIRRLLSLAGTVMRKVGPQSPYARRSNALSIESIIEKYQAGATMEALAVLTDTSTGTISRWIKLRGIKARSKGRIVGSKRGTRTAEQTQALEQDIRDGALPTLVAVAKNTAFPESASGK